MIQSFGDDEDDSDDDADDGDFESTGTIFGITTALSISKSYASGCLDQLRKYIIEKVDKYAPENQKPVFLRALNDDDNKLAFLINERFINIPPQISVPLLENLNKEITRAAIKKQKYSFTHYIMLIKFYRRDPKQKQKRINNTDELIYSNVEEEILCEKCVTNFEYSVQNETDTGLSGNWSESDQTLIPYRKLVLFDVQKLNEIIESIKEVTSDE